MRTGFCPRTGRPLGRDPNSAPQSPHQWGENSCFAHPGRYCGIKWNKVYENAENCAPHHWCSDKQALLLWTTACASSDSASRVPLPPGSHLGFSDPPNSSQSQHVSLGVKRGKPSQFVHKLKRSLPFSLSHRKPSETGMPYVWFPS